jgi:hypothetical protein
VTSLGELADAIDLVRNERGRREQERADAAARADEHRRRVHGQEGDPEEGEGEGESDGDGEGEGEGNGDGDPAEERVAVAAAAGTGTTPAPTVPAQPRRVQRINVPLSEIRARAPQPEVRPSLAITAAADVPRYMAGRQFENISELADAMHERAKTTPVSASGQVSGPKVATIKREFEHVIGHDSSPAEVSQMIKELTSPQALVAGGGWCAPSEITYEFFDITCEDGMIDLPTFGVQRGGLRWPTSPSMADVFTGTFTNATNPWLWTETDDILTVTGSTNKPCVRVPCPSFNEARLECYGICLTAGNLTDNAYPEATENQLSLLRSAHFHAMNQRYIATLVAASTVVATGGFFIDAEMISADLPNAIGWAATDYRTRFGMCEDDILEVVVPFWAREVMRGDYAQRTGVDFRAITDAQIDADFDVRKVRVQYVKDWQVRTGNQPGGSTPSQLYPATVQFMIYAAGTFGLGNGMTLDLGVVRDSTLNAENDHTAAWSEECHLIAMFGHSSRLYTVGVCAAGRTGVANIADCSTS